MHIEGSYTFHAPREAVWDAIMDPEVMGKALPGGEKLERISETDYVGVMDVRVGPVQGKFQGKIELLEANRPESCTMKVDGRGTPGFLSGTGSWSLAADGTGTVMTYSGEVEVGGKIANVGQRLLESSAKSITRQGLESLDAQIQARSGARHAGGASGRTEGCQRHPLLAPRSPLPPLPRPPASPFRPPKTWPRTWPPTTFLRPSRRTSSSSC